MLKPEEKHQSWSFTQKIYIFKKEKIFFIAFSYASYLHRVLLRLHPSPPEGYGCIQFFKQHPYLKKTKKTKTKKEELEKI